MSAHDTPTVLVLFGATGDLVKKKVAPALFELYCENKLPKDFKVLGMARSAHTDETFRAHIGSLLSGASSSDASKQISAFVQLFHYVSGDFTSATDYQVLKKRFLQLTAKKRCNTLFFFSVLPEHYAPIFSHIAKTGIATEHASSWARLLIEKPIGSDEKTARTLNKTLARLFHERQIYRIEHYLAKDMVQAILPFRFGNPMFSWSNKTIERVHISLLESNTADGRGVFYETVGALRDVGQNHLLQMLALVAMDTPRTWDAVSVQEARARILKKLPLFSKKDVQKHTFRAQYKGYTDTKHVSPRSRVETYYRTVTTIRDARWRGVPFIMESGKGFATPKKAITIVYKPGVFPNCDTHVPSTLTFEIEPTEEVRLVLSTQRPGALVCGSAQEVHIPLPRPEGYVKRQYIDEYKKIFTDALKGEKSSFVSAGEVHAMWRFVDPIVRAWKKDAVPLHVYEKNSQHIITTADNIIHI